MEGFDETVLWCVGWPTDAGKGTRCCWCCQRCSWG